MVDCGLPVAVGVEGLKSVGEAVVITDSLLGVVGGDVVRVAEALCDSRLNRFRLVTRVEVANEKGGTVVFCAEALESGGKQVDLILARLVGVGKTSLGVGLSLVRLG